MNLDLEKLQFELWFALDNKDRKYINEFAQMMFDKIDGYTESLKSEFERDNSPYWDLEHDLENAQCEIEELYYKIEELEMKLRS